MIASLYTAALLALLTAPSRANIESAEQSWDDLVRATLSQSVQSIGSAHLHVDPYRIVRQGDPAQNMVGVTFDDGPSSFTDGAIEALALHDVQATFFMLGEKVVQDPAMARRVARRGHEIGNHTFSHRDYCTTEMLENPDREQIFRDEVEKTARAILDATGDSPALLRMPYGCAARWAESEAQGLGYTLVFWSVDAQDWKRPGTDAIEKEDLAAVRPGSIILLHDGGGDRSQTMAAIDNILSGLEQKGLRPVSISELMGRKSYLPRLASQR
ncbi:MAG: polysaccharide deacetylase family protein [Elusimicrobia bacterium]|nr:polysaccharide deacetylase family protein [Elusimicrobiota bacterium]